MITKKMFSSRDEASKVMFGAIMAVFLPAIAISMFTRPDESSPKCTANHPLVGVSAGLNTRSHDVAGRVTIVDDCTFKIGNFSHDGIAPAVYWWGATDTRMTTSALRAGRRVVEEEVPFGNGIDTYVGTLVPGVTWDDIWVLYAWCEAFDVSFGEAVLRHSK